jgi:hypothetical protein
MSVLTVALATGSCALNPQPLPPDQGDDAGSAASESHEAGKAPEGGEARDATSTSFDAGGPAEGGRRDSSIGGDGGASSRDAGKPSVNESGLDEEDVAARD